MLSHYRLTLIQLPFRTLKSRATPPASPAQGCGWENWDVAASTGFRCDPARRVAAPRPTQTHCCAAATATRHLPQQHESRLRGDGREPRRQALAAGNRELAKRTRALAEGEAIHEAFVGRLANFRVLDPACGSGNFLYVALARSRTSSTGPTSERELDPPITEDSSWIEFLARNSKEPRGATDGWKAAVIIYRSTSSAVTPASHFWRPQRPGTSG
jgi:hypothetical protein